MFRIRTSLLHRLVLQHRSTIVDTGCYRGMPLVTGFTTWTSESGEACIEIAWRWGELREAIVMLDPQRIQTNLLLIGPAGREEPRPRALIYMVEYVETLPWRTPVRQHLIDSRH